MTTLQIALGLAVERSRRFNREDYPCWPTDAAAIVDAYLAKHPQDEDEPVTEEWLLSAGFNDQSVRSSPQKKLWFAGGFSIYAGPKCLQVGGQRISINPTRGDVRRLCQALGIELKETAASAD